MNERSDGMSETCPKCRAAFYCMALLEDNCLTYTGDGDWTVFVCGTGVKGEQVREDHTCKDRQLAAKDAEIERLREQRVQLRKLVEHVAECNPYPPDIFIEPTKEQFTAFNAHLKEFGLDPSAYNGSMGRRTWRVCCEDILRAFDEYIEDTDEAALEQTP